MEEILQPAIDLAENGFVVSQVSASLWKEAEEKLKNQTIVTVCPFSFLMKISRRQ